MVAWDLMRRGADGAREALPLIEMALATDQGAESDGFAEAEAADVARLMAVCLTLLAAAGEGAGDETARAALIIDRDGLDGAEIAATAADLRSAA
jgi:hypothetical protein